MTSGIVARCVVMQKNEVALLEPWILHHAYLFGFKNLTVIDNGSTDPAVLALLRTSEQRGVTVERNYNAPEDFVRKGDVITNVIKQWDRDGGYDLAFPLDCDEFLVALTDVLSCQRSAVHAALEPLVGAEATLINQRVLLNVPHRPGYFIPQVISRAIFSTGTAVSLCRGLHRPLSRYPNRWLQAPLACLHLHNRPRYEDIKAMAREKLRHLTGDQNPAMMEPTEAGNHLYHYFKRSEAEFLQLYRGRADLYLPGVIAHFRQLGVDPRPLFGQGGIAINVHPPTGYLAHKTTSDDTRHLFDFFDASYYEQNNPDVKRDTTFGAWPLVHYIRHGLEEGRRPNAVGFQPIEIISAAMA